MLETLTTPTPAILGGFSARSLVRESERTVVILTKSGDTPSPELSVPFPKIFLRAAFREIKMLIGTISSESATLANLVRVAK